MCISFQQSAFLQLITSTLHPKSTKHSLTQVIWSGWSGLGTWWAKWRPVFQSWWRSTWGSRPRRPPRPPRPSFCNRSAFQCLCLGLKCSTQLIIFSASARLSNLKSNWVGWQTRKRKKKRLQNGSSVFLQSKHFNLVLNWWLAELGRFGGYSWSTSARCLCGWVFGWFGRFRWSRVTCGLLLSVQLVSSREADLPVFVWSAGS